MKPTTATLATALLVLSLFAGCAGNQPTPNQDAVRKAPNPFTLDGETNEFSDGPATSYSFPGDDAATGAENTDATAPQGPSAYNQALQLIDGLAQNGHNADNLASVKHYGDEVGMAEVSLLEHCELFLNGNGDAPYFLIVPQYINSKITVQTVEWRYVEQQGASTFVPTDILHQMWNTADSGGLLVSTPLIEGGNTIRVTVEYGGRSAHYDFTELSDYGLENGMWHVKSPSGVFENHILAVDEMLCTAANPDVEGTVKTMVHIKGDQTSILASSSGGDGSTLIYASKPEISPSRKSFSYIGYYRAGGKVFSQVTYWTPYRRGYAAKFDMADDFYPNDITWLGDDYLLVTEKKLNHEVALGGSVYVYDVNDQTSRVLFYSGPKSVITGTYVLGDHLYFHMVWASRETFEMPLSDVEMMILNGQHQSVGL